MSPAFVEKEVVVNPGKTSTVEVRIKPLGSVSGAVDNVSTDSLLKGVRIQLVDRAGKVVSEQTTGDDGAYKFPGLESGTYVVRMLLPKGYLAQGDAEVTLEVHGGSAARADFHVYRHGAIEGRVVSEDGTPMADAEVTLVDSTGTTVRTARTDPQGVYAFLDVPVDKYRVRVEVPDELTG